MLGKRGHRLKYEAVRSDEEARDVEEVRRRIVSPACLWSSLFTASLIGTYYIPSICLTFYQRWLYQNFHFPLVTVLVHMIVKYLLACLVRWIMEKRQGRQRVLLGWRDYVIAVAPVGIFSGLDIGFSNWGLELIQISLYTMTKSTTIVFILAFSILFKLEKKSWSLCVIVVMITIGLILFTYEATQFDLLGFLLLLLASVSSGVRWTCVQLLLQKSKMGMRNPIDMIYHMQPWMILSVLPFAIWMEAPAVVRNCQLFNYADATIFWYTSFKVLLGAFIAFFMEVSEVMVITYTSSLTLAVAGIVKEVFILVLAFAWTGDTMSTVNFAGLVICLLGITLHVIHKLRTTAIRNVGGGSGAGGRGLAYEVEGHELGEHLMVAEGFHNDVSSDDSDRSDTQVLFDILNTHDR